ITKNAKGIIEVNGANSMTVYLRGLTDVDPDAPTYVSGDNLLAGRAAATVNDAQNKGYDALLAAHKADYKSLFDRCQLTLGDVKNNIPTPQLISSYRNNQHDILFLEELYFNYGRYLLISSSRGVSLPANLQGIWNDNNTPAWHSDIHANINVQMNYWPAEPTNLSELHRPFLDYIYREACVKPTWRRFAQDMGHVNTGWTLPTENNIYGSGTTFANTYTVANAWYCQHLWQHYTYTMDKDFLRTKAFPAMKAAVDYWFKKLVKAADGTYECPNE
ncbi:MAG: glycoside hydrolase family 95 protein, partial [Porphyromonas sp.]|nr:glycoside hydrolase family 95 protein [Porphyromonas sp.]